MTEHPSADRLTPDVIARIERGQRRVRCDCRAASCEGWAWARPDLCPACGIGDHQHHLPTFFAASCWCACPTCDPLSNPDDGAEVDLLEMFPPATTVSSIGTGAVMMWPPRDDWSDEIASGMVLPSDAD